MGRLLVERRSRDYEVKLGNKVVVLSGGFPKSGGSMKYPSCAPYEGTILKVRDVPVTIVENEMQEKNGISIVCEEPIVDNEKTFVDSLSREKLLKVRDLVEKMLKDTDN